MTTLSTSNEAATLPQPSRARTLWTACAAHALHDGYTDLIYLLLPIWQAEFAIGYGALAFLRALAAASMAVLQVPAGRIAERIGGRMTLAVGTALAALGYVVAGYSTGLVGLCIALVVIGCGLSTQHPIASAAVSRAYQGDARGPLGTYNFAGDIGKMVVPAAASMLLLVLAWRPTVGLLGVVGFVAAIAIFIFAPRLPPEHAHEQRTAVATAGATGTTSVAKGSLLSGFWLLLTIASIDSATRAGFLVFLPFLMIAKGTSVTTAGLALTLTFVGGATGKLVCAYLGRWFGVVATICLTKLATAVGMMAILLAPAEIALVLLPPCGAMLNGASSVTYGSVPDFVTPAGRTRAFSLFYTGTLGAGALAPTISGLVGDALGIPTTIVIIAALMLASLPLAWLLRPALARSVSAL